MGCGAATSPQPGAALSRWEPSLETRELPRDYVGELLRQTLPSRELPQLLDSHALPAGWESAYDTSSQRRYYFHRGTGRTTWSRPLVEPPPPPPLSSPPDNPGAAVEVEILRRENHDLLRETIDSLRRENSRMVAEGAELQGLARRNLDLRNEKLELLDVQEKLRSEAKKLQTLAQEKAEELLLLRLQSAEMRSEKVELFVAQESLRLELEALQAKMHDKAEELQLVTRHAAEMRNEKLELSDAKNSLQDKLETLQSEMHEQENEHEAMVARLRASLEEQMAELRTPNGEFRDHDPYDMKRLEEKAAAAEAEVGRLKDQLARTVDEQSVLQQVQQLREKLEAEASRRRRYEQRLKLLQRRELEQSVALMMEEIHSLPCVDDRHKDNVGVVLMRTPESLSHLQQDIGQATQSVATCHERPHDSYADHSASSAPDTCNAAPAMKPIEANVVSRETPHARSSACEAEAQGLATDDSRPLSCRSAHDPAHQESKVSSRPSSASLWLDGPLPRNYAVSDDCQQRGEDTPGESRVLKEVWDQYGEVNELKVRFSSPCSDPIVSSVPASLTVPTVASASVDSRDEVCFSSSSGLVLAMEKSPAFKAASVPEAMAVNSRRALPKRCQSAPALPPFSRSLLEAERQLAESTRPVSAVQMKSKLHKVKESKGAARINEFGKLQAELARLAVNEVSSRQPCSAVDSSRLPGCGIRPHSAPNGSTYRSQRPPSGRSDACRKRRVSCSASEKLQCTRIESPDVPPGVPVQELRQPVSPSSVLRPPSAQSWRGKSKPSEILRGESERVTRPAPPKSPLTEAEYQALRRLQIMEAEGLLGERLGILRNGMLHERKTKVEDLKPVHRGLRGPRLLEKSLLHDVIGADRGLENNCHAFFGEMTAQEVEELGRRIHSLKEKNRMDTRNCPSSEQFDPRYPFPRPTSGQRSLRGFERAKLMWHFFNASSN